jgi:hypothetical protein
VAEILDQAFNQARDAIRNIPDADLDKSVQFFGRTMTIRGVLILMGDRLCAREWNRSALVAQAGVSRGSACLRARFSAVSELHRLYGQL